MFLGGADIQVPAIEKAKSLGYHVVTADYLPGNPGHKVSDEYHNVSTTDIDAIVDLAARIGVDAVSAYASDPAALTAAHVSEKLGIPGNQVAAITKFADKIEFRKLQSECEVALPPFAEVNSAEEVAAFVRENGRSILKPVDSSGSKGISRVTLESDFSTLFDLAAHHTRVGRVIIEQELDREARICSGDAMVVNGRVAFHCFGDVHFGGPDRLVPVSITIPHTVDTPRVEKVVADLQKLFTAAGIREGVFNLDVLFPADGSEGVIIDIGARNGGNHFNNIISSYTGFDLIEATLRQAGGLPVEVPENLEENGFHAHFVIHSDVAGRFVDIQIPEFAKGSVVLRSVSVEPGDEIRQFRSSADRIGLLLLDFPSRECQERFKRELPGFAKVIVDE